MGFEKNRFSRQTTVQNTAIASGDDFAARSQTLGQMASAFDMMSNDFGNEMRQNARDKGALAGEASVTMDPDGTLAISEMGSGAGREYASAFAGAQHIAAKSGYSTALRAKASELMTTLAEDRDGVDKFHTQFEAFTTGMIGNAPKDLAGVVNAEATILMSGGLSSLAATEVKRQHTENKVALSTDIGIKMGDLERMRGQGRNEEADLMEQSIYAVMRDGSASGIFDVNEVEAFNRQLEGSNAIGMMKSNAAGKPLSEKLQVYADAEANGIAGHSQRETEQVINLAKQQAIQEQSILNAARAEKAFRTTAAVGQMNYRVFNGEDPAEVYAGQDMTDPRIFSGYSSALGLEKTIEGKAAEVLTARLNLPAEHDQFLGMAEVDDLWAGGAIGEVTYLEAVALADKRYDQIETDNDVDFVDALWPMLMTGEVSLPQLIAKRMSGDEQLDRVWDRLISVEGQVMSSLEKQLGYNPHDVTSAKYILERDGSILQGTAPQKDAWYKSHKAEIDLSDEQGVRQFQSLLGQIGGIPTSLNKQFAAYASVTDQGQITEMIRQYKAADKIGYAIDAGAAGFLSEAHRRGMHVMEDAEQFEKERLAILKPANLLSDAEKADVRGDNLIEDAMDLIRDIAEEQDIAGLAGDAIRGGGGIMRGVGVDPFRRRTGSGFVRGGLRGTLFDIAPENMGPAFQREFEHFFDAALTEKGVANFHDPDERRTWAMTRAFALMENQGFAATEFDIPADKDGIWMADNPIEVRAAALNVDSHELIKNMLDSLRPGIESGMDGNIFSTDNVFGQMFDAAAVAALPQWFADSSAEDMMENNAVRIVREPGSRKDLPAYTIWLQNTNVSGNPWIQIRPNDQEYWVPTHEDAAAFASDPGFFVKASAGVQRLLGQLAPDQMKQVEILHQRGAE